jgi:hypothetical protein
MHRVRRSLHVLRFCFLHCIFLLREHFFRNPRTVLRRRAADRSSHRAGEARSSKTLDGEDHCENAGLDLSAEGEGERENGRKEEKRFGQEHRTGRIDQARIVTRASQLMALAGHTAANSK